MATAAETVTQPVQVLELDRPGLESWLGGLGEPPYRARQILGWVYRQGVSDFGAMTDLPAALRRRLAEQATVGIPRVVERRQARDGTVKLLLQYEDGSLVEAVRIPEADRVTACLSSQVGCGLGCAFCATGLGGLVRNLTAGEILGQLLALNEPGAPRVTNVVFMGMGEPLANYGPVLEAVRRIRDPACFGIGARRITLSTVGLAPRIRRLAAEGLQIVLAVSLHAATDAKRARLVPLNRRYPLAEVVSACHEYQDRTGRRVSFEYTLIRGINDESADARALGRLLRPLRAHVNLIPLNPVPETGLERPTPARVAAFAHELAGQGIAVTLRRERGADIEAACGQLRHARERPAP